MTNLRSLAQALRIPPYVYYVIIASFGGFIFGFDTGSIGSITVMDQFIDVVGHLNSRIEGLLVSIILIPAAIVSSGAGSIADRISRTYATALGCVIYGAGSLIALTAGLGHSSSKAALAQVFMGRVISGAGEGVFLSAVSVYGIEVAPARLRGRIGSILQVQITLGIMLGYFTCFGSSSIAGSLAWRTPWVLQTVVCFALAAALPFVPHSPRWLVHEKRFTEARAALKRLGLDETEVPFHEPEEENAVEEDANASKGPRKSLERMKASFASDVRGRMLLALFMSGVQQLSGIDGVLFYAPTLFRQAGLSSKSATFLASGITGVVNFVFTVIGQFVISDKWGRRPALIFGGMVMATAMTVMGALYSQPNLSAAGKWAAIALIYVYFIAFILTWAILIRVWVSESQPVKTRASVSSLALTTNWICNFVITFSTPIFLNASPSGPYWMWAGWIWVAVAIFALWLPETRGRSIDGEGQELGLENKLDWVKAQYQTLSKRKTSMTMIEMEGGRVKETKKA
ncbi:general substrate transporter [Epithele typhae]|uniref:general substrate transporter n=1 Tax=Epithele typhae TaxID=378194 RepID=UPI0020089D3B|nr:general substrate transporter [Epithele typhae]KAH9938959.1 general substrate transporter [Epithele typhae]